MNPGLNTSQTNVSVLPKAFGCAFFPFQDTTSHYTVTFSTLGLPVAVMVSRSFQVLNDLDCLEAAMKRILFISLSQALFDGFLMIVSEFWA